MGMIIPNVPADSSVPTAFDSSIAVLTPPGETPATGADASLLSRSDFAARDLPAVSGMRDARFQVVFKQTVLDEIHAHGKSSMEAEVCGVLVGDIYSDRMAPWAYVEHSIRGNNAVGKQTQVTITSETWTRIHETLESQYPGKKIIGWYHTHPGFGIFLSGMDLFIQDNFFNQPWQLATVYDPHSGDEGTFIWRGGKSVRENVLVENDLAPPAAAGAAMSSEAMAAIEVLTKRVRQLERRIDRILTGFCLLVLVVLVAPLVLMALGPDTLRRLPFVHQPTPAPAAHDDAGKAKPAGATPAPAAPNTTILITPDALDVSSSGSGKAPAPRMAPGH